MTEKKTVKKKMGAPQKYKALLTKKTWDQIEQLVSRGMSRTFIAKFFDVNKDTLLKAIREKGFDNFEDLRKHHEEDFFGQIKAKFKTRVIDKDDMSDKLLIYAMDNYVIPFEEFNKDKNKEEGIKVVYVPVADFSDPEKLQQAAQTQQENLEEQINQHMRDNNID